MSYVSEDLTNAIQQLLILGKGDAGRLEYILDILKKGRTLPESDQKYLQNMISIYLNSKQQDPDNNMESIIEKLHQEIDILNKKVDEFEKKGFEKYVGRKTVFFFITVFVGWNALQSYIQQLLTNMISPDYLQYAFPLQLALSYYDVTLVWFAFVLVLLAWPFIGLIHLVKFIQFRKRKTTQSLSL